MNPRTTLLAVIAAFAVGVGTGYIIWRQPGPKAAAPKAEEELAGGQTFPLALKRLDSDPTTARKSPLGAMVSNVSSQSAYFGYGNDNSRQFRKAVTKDREDYKSEDVLRGGAHFGSHDYGYALDTTDIKQGYDLLYFDVNGNGDLSDDKPIQAMPPEPSRMMSNGVQRVFPRVDLTVDLDGKPLDYAFYMQLQTQRPTERDTYTYLNITPAVYREGDIELQGKPHHVILVDFNSNGRFGDEFSVSEDADPDSGRVYAMNGDVLYVDPDLKAAPGSIPEPREDRVQLSKTVAIAGAFYHPKVVPTGEALTVAASRAGRGFVSSKVAKYSAQFYGPGGILNVHSDGAPVTLPEGQWRLLSYRIDMTGAPAASAPATTAPAAESRPAVAVADESTGSRPAATRPARSLGAALAAAIFKTGEDEEGQPILFGARRQTAVSASGTTSCKMMTIKPGETVRCEFGPPYRPVVKPARYWGPREEMRLEMSLIGSGGELCSDMEVRGSRPAKPTFTIISPEGEIVERGAFEYG